MYGMSFDIADRMEASNCGYRCQGAGCGITVACDPEPMNHNSMDLRDQIRKRLCTACWRNIEAKLAEERRDSRT